MSEIAFANLQEWLRLDTDPESREYVSQLTNKETIEELFGEQISFGTAGLRGKLGPGYSRMNTITVQLTTQAIVEYLQETEQDKRPVIIGYDHRHGSLEFAKTTAAVFASKGFKVLLYGQLVPTPYVPFGLLLLDCCFGVMITASHNPRGDNGYKVYGADGCQIGPPVDNEIAKRIPQSNRSLWPLSLDLTFEDPFDRVHEAYIKSTTTAWSVPEISTTPPKIVYTPMHGVGGRFVNELLHHATLPALIYVPEQARPDPYFPTLDLPNPEEGAGALSLAMKLAKNVDAPLIFANDPDADRFNFAELRADGTWHIFNGNEIALLLAEYLLRSKKTKQAAMVSSIVSSQALGWMAKADGFHFEQAQTGFKNLAAKAIELEAADYNVLLTYEEAIGYMVGTNVRDKDGLSALLVAYNMVIQTYAQGSTLHVALDSLYAKYGYPVQYNSYFRCPGKTLAVFSVAVDKAKSLDGSLGPYKIQSLTFPAPNMLMLSITEPSSWLAIRVSGTEPKIKFYSECKAETSVRVPSKQSELSEMVRYICEALLEPARYNLVLQS